MSLQMKYVMHLDPSGGSTSGGNQRRAQLLHHCCWIRMKATQWENAFLIAGLVSISENNAVSKFGKNPLIQKSLYLPVLNRQYQDGKNTNQNQMKNTCPIFIIFQVLKLLLTKIYETQPSDLLFLIVFISR